jgi:hypothetical protein
VCFKNEPHAFVGIAGSEMGGGQFKKSVQSIDVIGRQELELHAVNFAQQSDGLLNQFPVA